MQNKCCHSTTTEQTNHASATQPRAKGSKKCRRAWILLWLAVTALFSTQAICQDVNGGAAEPDTTTAQNTDRDDATSKENDEKDLHTCSEGTSPWCKTFFFGIQFLPDYDVESGAYSGLDEQAFFAHFRFESLRSSLRSNERLDSFGFDIRLHQSGAVSGTDEVQTPAIPARFNDVSDTLDLSGHYTFIFSDSPVLYEDGVTGLLTSPAGPRYGIKVAGGGRTREGAIEDEDTLSTYAAVAFSYAYHDAMPALVLSDGAQPRRFITDSAQGEFDIGVAWYEDWAGRQLKLDEPEDWRIVFRGVYQLRNQWFLGVLANGGKGPDEVSVFFGARKSVGDLLNFLGLSS